jgi:1,4-alpha-glucan branching enzyme
VTGVQTCALPIWDGFQWIVPDDSTQNIVVFRRIDDKKKEVIVVCNFSAVTRENYRFGVPPAKHYKQVLSSDSAEFGGAGLDNGLVPVEEIASHDLADSISITIPPLSAMWFEPVGVKPGKKVAAAKEKPAPAKKTTAKAAAEKPAAAAKKVAAKAKTAPKTKAAAKA